ncbi:DUF4192 domain-containing protein [Actinomycetospora flava]|uniref:DUF4192 domain-containing protein n=1 Tax=Actinomycetospora flava TaxID=3129232 RepID=A0ABU8LYW2_9PSEU
MSTDHRPRPPDADRPELRLRDPGELVAAVPHLIGFPPVESLVLVAVHGTDGAPGGRRLGVVARTDLPPPPETTDAVHGLATRMAPAGPREVIAVVVGGGNGDPPRRDVADAVGAAFAGRRIGAPTRLWVPRIAGGAPWRCYPPCDCRGTVGPTEDSPFAAAAAWLGHVTFGSRAELEASLAAGPPDPQLAELIRAELEAAILDRELGGPAAARRDLAAVAAARDEVAAGRVLTDVEIARLAVALGDPAVRDVAMGWALDPDEAAAGAARQLWTLLVRRLPAPEVADPAVMLACALLVRGGGALVGVALDRARRADPGHRLAAIVEALLATGAGPDAVRRIIRDSSAETAERLRGRAG